MPARTQLDIPITIPSGNARKLVALWGTQGDPGTVTVTFDPTGTPITLPAASRGSIDTLRVAGYFLDTPAIGAKVLRVVTTNEVWSAVSLAVLQDAAAGNPNAQISTNEFTQITTLIEPTDAFSETIDLVLTDGIGGLVPLEGQVILGDDAVNDGAFHAASSRRTHPHSGEESMGWSTASDANLLQISFNVVFSSGQEVPSEVTPLSLWELGEAGTVFADSKGLSPLSLRLGSVGPGADPLLSGGAGAISVQNSLLAASHVAAWQVSAYWITVFCQPRSAPANNANRLILFKDVGSPAGGISIEQYDDSSLLRAYVRSNVGGVGSAIWVGAQTGQGALTLNVAHRIDLTFDGTTARLYLDRVEVASNSDAALTGCQGNVSTLEVASRNVGDVVTAPFDGIIGQKEIQSGAPSAATIAAAAAAVTISDPGPPGGITMEDIPLGNVAPGSTTLKDPLSYATGLGAGNRNLVEVPSSDTFSRMDFVSNGTPAAQIRVIVPSPGPANQVNESARATIAEGEGPPSNEFTVSWTRPGTSTSTFPFVTGTGSLDNHTGVAAKPGYSASDPMSATIIDPATGIPLVRLTGNQGDIVRINGTTNSGLVFPLVMRNDNSTTPSRVWNADGSMLFLDESKGATSCDLSLLIDMAENRSGARTGARGRIIRAAGTWALGKTIAANGNTSLINRWFWDPQNAARAYGIAKDGSIGEWWPVGEQGHSIDEYNTLMGPPPNASLYDQWGNGRAHLFHCSFDGRYFMQPCRRKSDGEYGGFLRTLTSPNLGASGPFCQNRHTTPIDDNQTSQGTSALGGFTKYQQSNVVYIVRSTDNTLMWKSDSIGLPDNNFSHQDFTVVNGVEYIVGPVGSLGVYMVPLADSTPTPVRICNLASGNPNHMSCRNYKDMAETYGQAGGIVTGQRYGFFSIGVNDAAKRGIRAYRLDPGGTQNVVRAICNHRMVRGDAGGADTNQTEVHCQPSPDGRMAAFPSNWRAPGQVTSYSVHGFVALLPPAWHNPNNSGL